MRIALVDDDQNCLDEMEKLCADFGARYNCHIETAAFTDAESFLHDFTDGSYSVVFMDIFMENTDGIAAAGCLRRHDCECLLVFLTSSTEFMPDAFSCHAFEYVLKPFSGERIESVLLDAMKILPERQKYMEVLSGRKTVRIFLDQIVSVMTDAHYLEIRLSDGSAIRTRMTVLNFQSETGEDPRFLTVNKGIVLNADYIADFEENCCILKDGSRFPVRVRDRLKIEQSVADYHFQKIRREQHHDTKYSKRRDSTWISKNG